MGRPGCGAGCGIGCARVGCWLMVCAMLGALSLGKLVVRRTNQRQMRDTR
jgi:hypothetical protein